MTHVMTHVWMAVMIMAFACVANAEGLTGSYIGKTDDDTIVLTLRQEKDGRVSGTLKGDSENMPINGTAKGNRMHATGQANGQKVSFTAVLKGDVLTLTVMGVTLTLTRTGAEPHAAPAPLVRPKVASAASGAMSEVRINGVRLDAAKMERIGRHYNLQFRSGDYWYDKRCGAWGEIGKPVSGLVAPNIDMGGPLRRDSSHGNTGVIVNGRELPLVEVLLLQQLGPVQRGRAWLDANGNFGREGGPIMNNLFLLAQQKQVPRNGILSTWDRTGLAVFDLR